MRLPGLHARTRGKRALCAFAIVGAVGAAICAQILANARATAPSEPAPSTTDARELLAHARVVPTPATESPSELAHLTRAVRLAWPAEGEAALEVEGVGRSISSGADTPVPIASVAKVMTAYLTLRSHPLARGRPGFALTVTTEDVREEQGRAALGESVLPVLAGEHLSERQALQALLLPSANNIAQMLAVHEAGSAKAFVAQMNAAARKLGMVATSYTDASGYTATTVSTALDQLRLAAAAMRLQAFAQIVDERSAVLPVAGPVTNYNQLVGHDGFVGIKTGSDSAAGGCLVFAKHVTVGSRRLTILGDVLGQRAGSYIPASLLAGQQLGDSAAGALRAGVLVAAADGALAGRELAQLL